MLDDLLGNPALRRALAAGEERVGRALARLMSSDAVSSGVSTLVTGALQARRTVEDGVRHALHAARLPSQDDLEALHRRLDEIESMIDRMADRVAARGTGENGGNGGTGRET
jgi:hypothetical protein